MPTPRLYKNREHSTSAEVTLKAVSVFPTPIKEKRKKKKEK